MKRSHETDQKLEWAELVLPYLPPSDLAATAATCKLLRLISQSVTVRRSSDASRNFEKHPIPFLNSVSAHPYSYFIYTPASLLPSSLPSQPWGGSGSKPSPSPASPLPSALTIGSGCQCPSCSTTPPLCPCSSSPITAECGSSCLCGPDCPNRSTQRGISLKLTIIRHPSKGWGLHAGEPIKRGEFICEYAGEYLTNKEAKKRQMEYDELAARGKVSPALLVVREHLPSGRVCLRVNVDATVVGNVGRFVNHSCDGGNLEAVVVRSAGAVLPRLCFFAKGDIQEGEELCFSYGEARVRPGGMHCFCGSDDCFRQLPSEET